MVFLRISKWRVERCCCFDLRVGSLIIAGLYLVASLFSSITLTVTAFASIAERKRSRNPSGTIDTSLLGLAVSSVFMIVMCIMLIRGILARKSYLIYPWICMNFAFIVGALATSIGSIIFDLATGTMTGFIEGLISLPIILGIVGYCYLVVYSLYREILEGSSRSNMGA